MEYRTNRIRVAIAMDLDSHYIDLDGYGWKSSFDVGLGFLPAFLGLILGHGVYCTCYILTDIDISTCTWYFPSYCC